MSVEIVKVYTIESLSRLFDKILDSIEGNEITKEELSKKFDNVIERSFKLQDRDHKKFDKDLQKLKDR